MVNSRWDHVWNSNWKLVELMFTWTAFPVKQFSFILHNTADKWFISIDLTLLSFCSSLFLFPWQQNILYCKRWNSSYLYGEKWRQFCFQIHISAYCSHSLIYWACREGESKCIGKTNMYVHCLIETPIHSSLDIWIWWSQNRIYLKNY